ncbi:hypothetical protein [Pendulispora albinea]|uniref:Lipoprotein n=1 Tax=Pendulispora albinea TaxID=2741071 RepID=A0ABZ2M3W3_9BACT
MVRNHSVTSPLPLRPRLALARLARPALCAVALASAACVVDDDRDHQPYSYGYWGDPSYGDGANPGKNGSSTPLLVEVDTDQTLNAKPGEGVGIYSEYSSGGHWYIWWTCDTNRDRAHRPCRIEVGVHAESGKLSNVRGAKLLASDTVVANSNGTDASASTTTTTNVAGILFDTDPGAIITLTAFVDGRLEPAYLFFVQAGQVNGGYPGRLTDPLRLQGSKP